MTIFEDNAGHILRRNNRDFRNGDAHHTWCVKCGAMVKIHHLTKEEFAYMGKKDTKRKPRAESLKPRNALTDYHMVVRERNAPGKGRPVDADDIH